MRKLILNFCKGFLYGKKNVVGLGVGVKVRGGRVTNERCITVAVQKKEGIEQLTKKDKIPKRLLGIKTDVVDVGRIEYQWRKKNRPVRMNGSCCWIGLTACSAGLAVWSANGTPYILMNKHCIKPSNAKVGDAVVQPSSADGGTIKDKIGEVTKYFFPEHYTRKDNIDYALVKLDERMVMEDVVGNDYVPKLKPVKVFQKITKGSRTTQDIRTSSPIISTDFEARVNGKDGKVYHYANSVLTLNVDENGDEIVMPGCSSSIGLIDNHPVVQTFAGSPTVGVFNKVEESLKDIEKRFGLKLYLTPQNPRYFVAAGRDWYINSGLGKRKTKVNLNVRSAPQVSDDTYIKTLPIGTEVEIINEVGYANEYYWVEISTLDK